MRALEVERYDTFGYKFRVYSSVISMNPVSSRYIYPISESVDKSQRHIHFGREVLFYSRYQVFCYIVKRPVLEIVLKGGYKEKKQRP